jgi:hypothetical protein
MIPADRHRQERASRSEHRRPRPYPGGLIDEKSPAHLAEMSRTSAAKKELSDGRMDPIGSDDEVIRARRTISEGHIDPAILLTERCHGCAEPHRDASGALEKNAMKFTASDAHAESNPVPELCQLDFCQQSSRVIQDSLMGHMDSSSEHGIRKPKRPESANAVPGEVQSGAASWPRCRTLDNFRNYTLLSQCSAECETRDSAADNQDA